MGVPDVLWDDWVEEMPEMKGKVVAITGCTSGTGYNLAEAVAGKGATVVMLNRKSERADDALEGVTAAAEEVGAPAPVFIPCDLMSFKSVRLAGAELNKQFAAQGLDVLVNNAGIMALKDVATEDGLDQQMQTNHTSHFLLTKLCMPLLEKAAALRGEARVVNHSSAARVMDGMENEIDAAYLDKNGGNLGGDSNEFFKGPNFQRYQQTKLANVVFTYALDQKLRAKGKPIKALVAHPGVSLETSLATQTFSTKGGITPLPLPPCLLNSWLGAKMMGMQSEHDASVGILRQTCDPDAKSGEFFGPVGKGGDVQNDGERVHDPAEYKGEVGTLKREPLADQKAQDTLWSVSEKVIGEKFYI
jgi:NAD(P)-dependent dehydrogenase (short-subunit alcohol dehydrogenase family)